MTIADNLQALANQKLGYQDSVEDCKTSLANKDVVVPVDAKLADISGLIDEVQQDPSIPVGSGQHLVTFYDFDGKVLKRQRVNTGEDAIAPATPTHEFLTFVEWNNPFTNVQSDIDTGAIYNTTDGKTYLFITLTAVTGLAPTLYFSKSSTSLMTIDWGDGTTSTSTTSGNQTINHVYATAGDYIITVDNSAGGMWTIGQGAAATALFFGYLSILESVYIGNYCLLNTFAFTAHISVKYVSLHSNMDFYSYSIFRLMRKLVHINCPTTWATIESDTFRTTYSIQKIVMSSNTSIAANEAFEACYNLKKIIIPKATVIGTNCFANCTNIDYYIFLSTTPQTLSNVNAFSGINPICKIYVPDASVAAYKAATNWNNFSAYIAPLSQKPQSDE